MIYPVRAGLVRSLSHPGGNVTGNTLIAPEVAAKRLEAMLLETFNFALANLDEEIAIATANALTGPAATRAGSARKKRRYALSPEGIGWRI